MTARAGYLLSALLLGASALAGSPFSSATFTDDSATVTQVTAAADWAAPTVVVTPLDAGTFGTVTVAATASDDRSDIASVELQYAAAGTSDWVSLTTGCTAGSGPSPLAYSCQWDTTTVADGDYEVRAVATDTASPIAFTGVSAAVPTQVANNASVVLTTVPSPTAGTVTLTGTLLNAGNGSRSIRFEYAVAGSGTWLDAAGCGVATTSDYTCSFGTAGLDGLYDVRAVGTRGGATFYDVQTDVIIDNTAPVVSLAAPAGVLSGSVQLTAEAGDTRSSVASVSIDYKSQGDDEWFACGTPTSAPYTCTFDSTTVPDGTYDFRAVATDAVGNISPASTQTRDVSNTVGEVAVSLPEEGAAVSGSAVAVAAVARSSRGVASVSIQYRAGSTGDFTEICVDESSPFACSWDVSGLDNGAYELRATMTEASGGGVLPSDVVGVTVDNAVGTVAFTTPTPGSTVTGTVNIAATARPASGKTVQSVTFQGPGGAAQPLCSPDATAPYTCSWDSTSVAYDAGYQLRAVLTHTDGTRVISTIVVKVDNVVGSTTSPLPSGDARVSGVVRVTTTVTSNAPAGAVWILATRTRGSGPATVSIPCVDGAGAPPTAVSYTCDWDTSAIANARYELLSRATLANGQPAAPSPASAVQVRNLRAQDVQAVAGTTANHVNRLGNGDQLVLTFSDVVSTNSVRPGWTGATTGDLPVTWTNNAAGDVLTFGTSANLGSITFAQNYVSANYSGAAVTMTATTVPGADGVEVTQIVLAFKVTGNPTVLVADATPGAMVWTPSAAVTDTATPAPVASSPAPVTESGTADSEF